MMIRNRSRGVIGSVSTAPPPISFILRVDTRNAGSATNTMIIPLLSSQEYDFNISWGDGDSEQVTGTGLTGVTHVYDVAGIKDISMVGLLPSIYFVNAGDKLKCTRIVRWGNNPWATLVSMFMGCNNLIVPATAGAPNFKSAVSARQMFRSAKFPESFTGWEFPKVTDFAYMFYSSISKNLPVTSWVTKNTTTLREMFRMIVTSGSFNQSLASWDIENVTNMSDMLRGQATFAKSAYEPTLISWAGQNTKNNVTAHFGVAKYSSQQAIDAKNVLLLRGWTITDGGIG